MFPEEDGHINAKAVDIASHLPAYPHFRYLQVHSEQDLMHIVVQTKVPKAIAALHAIMFPAPALPFFIPPLQSLFHIYSMKTEKSHEKNPSFLVKGFIVRRPSTFGFIHLRIAIYITINKKKSTP
jgi:hypothetical protein